MLTKQDQPVYTSIVLNVFYTLFDVKGFTNATKV